MLYSNNPLPSCTCVTLPDEYCPDVLRQHPQSWQLEGFSQSSGLHRVILSMQGLLMMPLQLHTWSNDPVCWDGETCWQNIVEWLIALNWKSRFWLVLDAFRNSLYLLYSAVHTYIIMMDHWISTGFYKQHAAVSFILLIRIHLWHRLVVSTIFNADVLKMTPSQQNTFSSYLFPCKWEWIQTPYLLSHSNLLFYASLFHPSFPTWKREISGDPWEKCCNRGGQKGAKVS